MKEIKRYAEDGELIYHELHADEHEYEKIHSYSILENILIFCAMAIVLYAGFKFMVWVV